MPQDAERLLREALTAIEEIHTDQCQAWCGYRELRGEIRAHLSSIESKERAVDEEVCPACFSAIRQPSTCADAWHRNPAPTVQSETPRPRDIEWLSPEVIKYVESLELRLAQRDTQLREAERRLRMAKALEGKTTVSEPHAYVQSETPEEPSVFTFGTRKDIPFVEKRHYDALRSLLAQREETIANLKQLYGAAVIRLQQLGEKTVELPQSKSAEAELARMGK